MGNKNTKSHKSKPLTKIDLEITLSQISSHLELNLNRSIGLLKKQEIYLRDKMQEKRYLYKEINTEFIPIVVLFKKIKSFKMILKYTKILKNHSIIICESQNSKNFDLLQNIQKYIEGLIFSADKINLKYLANFNKMIFDFFGKNIFFELKKFQNLDQNLIESFSQNEPNKDEISNYLKKFLDRYNIEMKDFRSDNQKNGKYKDLAVDDFLNQISDLKNIDSETGKKFFSKDNKKKNEENFVEPSEFDTNKEVLPINDEDFKKKKKVEVKVVEKKNFESVGGNEEFKIDFDCGVSSSDED